MVQPEETVVGNIKFYGEGIMRVHLERITQCLSRVLDLVLDISLKVADSFTIVMIGYSNNNFIMCV